MIIQYLQNEGFDASSLILNDEANVKWREKEESIAETKRLKKFILEGDWNEVDKLIARPRFKNHKAFLYSVYKVQFLELIENREIQKAFTLLNKRLKPLEHYQPQPQEFTDMCYLLSAKNVHDAPSFKNWEGIGASREKLVDLYQNMLDIDSADKHLTSTAYVPPDRLLHLLEQAVAYQVEFARYQSKISPVVKTLLTDYTSFVIPNDTYRIFSGHKNNVKCAAFVGEEGNSIVTGSSDNTLRLWNINSARSQSVMFGHTSRIWSVDSSRNGDILASASGDGTVKIWDAKAKSSCLTTLNGHDNDVYTVKFHPAAKHVVSGGYDKVIRLFDVTTGQLVKTFTGHHLAVTDAIFNGTGNLIVSASKDSSIRFWDVVSGLCIRTITSHLGEVTSVQMNPSGTQLLSGSKDNSNRLWDVRAIRPIRRFKGHQNTSKNFIRAGFAGEKLIVGGSEDGRVYIWDQETGGLLERLKGHESVVYNVAWNAQQNLFVSCSDDQTARVWWFDEKKAHELPSR